MILRKDVMVLLILIFAPIAPASFHSTDIAWLVLMFVSSSLHMYVTGRRWRGSVITNGQLTRKHTHTHTSERTETTAEKEKFPSFLFFIVSTDLRSQK